jgi:hypothetical protein
MTVTLELQPLLALIAGVLVLAVPKLLRFVVGFYLIALGVLGLIR